MIRSFGNTATRKIYEGKPAPKHFAGVDLKRACLLLDVLDAAQSLGDIAARPSLRLHKLSGDRREQWAMRINDGWRVVFEWHTGQAEKVAITDYHKG